MLAGALAGAYGFCQPTHQKSCLIPPTPVEAARLTARKSAAASSLLALQPQATATPTALGPGPAPECVQELMRQACSDDSRATVVYFYAAPTANQTAAAAAAAAAAADAANGTPLGKLALPPPPPGAGGAQPTPTPQGGADANNPYNPSDPNNPNNPFGAYDPNDPNDPSNPNNPARAPSDVARAGGSPEVYKLLFNQTIDATVETFDMQAYVGELSSALAVESKMIEVQVVGGSIVAMVDVITKTSDECKHLAAFIDAWQADNSNATQSLQDLSIQSTHAGLDCAHLVVAPPNPGPAGMVPCDAGAPGVRLKRDASLGAGGELGPRTGGPSGYELALAALPSFRTVGAQFAEVTRTRTRTRTPSPEPRAPNCEPRNPNP